MKLWNVIRTNRYRPGQSWLRLCWSETTWHEPTEEEFPAFQFLADLPGLFSVQRVSIFSTPFSFQVRYFTVAFFSVGNHDGKIHLTPIWAWVATPILATLQPFGSQSLPRSDLVRQHRQQMGSLLIRSAIRFVLENIQRSLYFNVRFCQVYLTIRRFGNMQRSLYFNGRPGAPCSGAGVSTIWTSFYL